MGRSAAKTAAPKSSRNQPAVSKLAQTAKKASARHLSAHAPANEIILEKEADAVARRVKYSAATGRVWPEPKGDAPPLPSLVTTPAVSASRQSANGPDERLGPDADLSLSRSYASGMLGKSARSFFEPLFGKSFEAVLIHNDRYAHEAAERLNARAFTIQNRIYFNESQFNPLTLDGTKLLAHELTHVVQQTAAGPDSVAHARIQRWQRSQEDTAETAAPPSANMRVSLSGIALYPANAFLSEGRTQPQMMAMILQRLLREEFRDEIVQRVIDELDRASVTWLGLLRRESVAPAGLRVHGPVTLDARSSLTLLHILERLHLEPDLTDDQRELLILGNDVIDIYHAIQQSDNPLPEWYTARMLAREMAQNADLLRAYHDYRLTLDDGLSISGNAEIWERIVRYVSRPARIIERIRVDYELGNDTNTRVVGGYRRLTGVSVMDTALFRAAPDSVDQSAALNFMRFIRTQPHHFEQALASRNTRKTLLERFERFYRRSDAARPRGDEQLLDAPATANARPWPADITVTPPIQEPLYEASLAADYRFVMSLRMGHWLDHFALYSYSWERVKIERPPRDESEIAELTGESERPTHEEVMELRRRRVRRYNQADIERVISEAGIAPNTGALELTVANNILRRFSAEFRGELQRLTEPRHEEVIAFPRPGLYMVRCTALPVLEGHEEVVRPPSVAYTLVNIMDPVDLAVAQHKRTMDIRSEARERMEEIEELLNQPQSRADIADLEQELLILRDLGGSIDDVLSGRRSRITSRLNPLLRRQQDLERRIEALERQPGNHDEALRRLNAERYIFRLRNSRIIRNLQSQLEDLDEISEAREGQHRDYQGPREQIDATFLNDSGLSINLLLEATRLHAPDTESASEEDDYYEFVVADLTTNTGNIGFGRGSSRTEAITRATADVLEENGDYGRGRLILTVDQYDIHREIHAGFNAILFEALENVTMVASLAAIVAAPFTGGASLYLLLPLGVAGALPSLYRLYERYSASTLRADLDVAMDFVNIIGGFIGLAHGGASVFRLVRMGRVLLVAGVVGDFSGYILMGAGVVQQLAALQGLPEGEKRERFMRIIFDVLLQFGMIAGGTLAQFQAQYEAHRRRRGPDNSSAPDAEVSARRGEARESREGVTEAERVPEVDQPEAVRVPPENESARRGGARTPEDAESVPHSVEHLEFPEGTVAAPPPVRDRSAAESARYRRDADEMYDTMWRGFAEDAADQAAARRREAAMFRNSETGEIILIQGDESSVYVTERGPGGEVRREYPAGGGQAQQWKEILDRADAGRWELLRHSHPIDPGTGAVAHYARFPSGATGDFSAVLFSAVSDNQPVSSRIDYMTADGPNHTIFGVTPESDRPVWIDYPDPETGSRQFLEFESIEAYHQWYQERFGSSLGAVPSSYRNLADAFEPRQDIPGQQEGSRAPAGERDPSAPRSPRDRSGREPESETGAEHEQRLILEDRASRARDPHNDFAMTLDYRGAAHNEPANTFARIRDEIRTRLEQLSQNHNVDAMPEFNPDVLQQRTIDYIMGNSSLRTLYTELDLALNQRNRAILSRPEWRSLSYSTLRFMRSNFNRFFNGFVHSRKPDVVDIDFRNRTIYVTDPTFQNNPFHHFKTIFYGYVIREMTGYSVIAQDITQRVGGIPEIRVLLDIQ